MCGLEDNIKIDINRILKTFSNGILSAVAAVFKWQQVPTSQRHGMAV
jgi:hypothetical protein